MRVPLNWLKEYVDIKLSPEELAEKLTLAGCEVGSIERREWEGVYIGLIEDIKPHPNAGKLKVVRVMLGDEALDVVCGAPNVRLGMKVPLAKPGALVRNPETGEVFRIEERSIRGVLSRGMICSERELGISEEHTGIMELPDDAPVGISLTEYIGDIIFDLKVTPNRPDLLSVFGVAWEVGAIQGERVRMPKLLSPEGDEVFGKAQVEIWDEELCPRYCAAVIEGVNIDQSPLWMKERLISAGMRPINNVVDITNYVLLEIGQPLHAFDLSRIKGRKIIVRRAKDEYIVTLDGNYRELDGNMLVIADEERPVAIAGIMGGAATEVIETTKDILLESACFSPTSIRRTSLRLGLRTEASLRFEKGLSPELPMFGIKRALKLIEELAGGRIAGGIIDIYPRREERSPLRMRWERARKVLGMDVEREEAKKIFLNLGFEIKGDDEGGIDVIPPFWRRDINIEDDLVEEFARIKGYDKIPETLLKAEIPRTVPDPMIKLKDDIRDILAGCGMQEIITYSLVSLKALKDTGSKYEPIKVKNPLSREQEYLRTNLRVGLLRTFSSNEKRTEEGLMFFEVGRIYKRREGELPEEREFVGGIMGGFTGRSWSEKGRELDFYDMKGIVETLLDRFGIKPEFKPYEEDFFIPGRACSAGDIGVMGEISPEVLEKFDIRRRAFLFELDIEKILEKAKEPVFSPLPRFPEVKRDISVIVDEGVYARDMEEEIRKAKFLENVFTFDVYRGEGIPKGKKSIAFSLHFRHPERTLRDDEVEEEISNIVKRLEDRFGAKLRGQVR